ncbi:MAG TPA: hypothetical protein EYG25_02015 [Candidatus Poseidoniales archaeon]|nr:hypothetical protein [Candidatus Poseidoniales archaeon]
MRQSLFVALMLCLTPVLAGCLDSLTGDEELRTGCTYTEAENWDPQAQIDDGSCDLGLEGCTYEGAENYNPSFVVDDGSCVFADPVVGCMDPAASNYNSYAEYADDSCVYLLGCTYEDADNYDSSAQVDNGTCEFAEPVTGCMDDTATNYNQYAEYDDDSCEYLSGCTYDDADNYNSSATVDDGSCNFPDPVLGCTDDAAANYNPYATIDDDSCYYLYASLTSEEFNDFANLFTEQKDFTLWSDDFDRFGSEMKINPIPMVEEMDEGGEGGDNGTEDDEEEEMPEEMYIVLGMQKDDASQIFTATFGMEMSMEGDPMEMGAEDGEAKMSLRMTSVRQGPGCTSGDCTLTNEVMEVSMYVGSEGPGTKMIMSMYMFATTYSRDMVPYYGDPVAELPGGGSFFLGQSEPEEVEIIRDGDNVMFSPAEIEIEVDTTVIWYNDDDTTHTVTAEDGTFDSGDIDPYSEWEYTFGEVGEYAYYSDKTEDKDPFGNLTGRVIVTEIEPIDLDWDTEAGVGLDSDDDGKDDWIEYYAYAWDDEENMSIAATLTQNIETGTLYPRHLEFHNETGVPIMAFEFWYGDEVYIELNDDEGLNKSATQFNWDADSYDDNETSQNVYEGTISEGNGNYMQEAPNDEMEIRVLEAYEGSDDEDPGIGDPFGGDEEEEGGRENARVVASMILSDGGDDMVDTETGCHWYITWNDNDGDGLVSVNDTYEIRSDKMGTGGEVCNREGENGNATYVIEFFDLWADAYVDGPNPALAPGFTGLFAAFAIAGLAGLRRRRR